MIPRILATGLGLIVSGSPVLSAEQQATGKEAPEPQPEIVIEGIEDLEPEIASRLMVAARKFLPKMVQARGDLRVMEEPLVEGLDEIWITDPDIAYHLEAVARETLVGGVELSSQEGDLTIVPREDGLSFRVNSDYLIHLVVLRWGDDGALHTQMAATMHLPHTEIKVVDGKAQVSAGDVQGTIAGSDGGGQCAGTQDGVCCSFTRGEKIRIVCMCRSQSGPPRYEVCGDTGWM